MPPYLKVIFPVKIWRQFILTLKTLLNSAIQPRNEQPYAIRSETQYFNC
jgi:hypothetical protein